MLNRPSYHGSFGGGVIPVKSSTGQVQYIS